MNRLLILLLLGGLLIWACEKEESPKQSDTALFQKGEGVFIINEGGFNFGNASVDYYNFDTGIRQPSVFQSINNKALGDVFQRFTILGNWGYLVLNNSSKIEVVRMDSFQLVRTISGLNSPRDILAINENEAYVSDLYANAITRIDLNTGEKLGTIDFPGWSEEMILLDDQVFVSNPWDQRVAATQYIYVVDPSIHQLVDSIQVGFDPSAMVLDANDKLWVFCRGNEEVNALGGLYQIDPSNRAVLKSLPFRDFNHSFAPRLETNAVGDELYYLKQDVFKVSIQASELPDKALVNAAGRLFYGLATDPHNSVWIADAIDFQQRGVILNYDLNGTLISSFDAGIIPSGFVFY